MIENNFQNPSFDAAVACIEAAFTHDEENLCQAVNHLAEFDTTAVTYLAAVVGILTPRPPNTDEKDLSFLVAISKDIEQQVQEYLPVKSAVIFRVLIHVHGITQIDLDMDLRPYVEALVIIASEMIAHSKEFTLQFVDLTVRKLFTFEEGKLIG